MSRGVSTVSCQPALDVHSPARSPLPTSSLQAAQIASQAHCRNRDSGLSSLLKPAAYVEGG